MAQATRAILLAKATAATLRGRRSSNFTSQAEAVLLPGLAWRITAVAPTTSKLRSRSLPARLIPPRICRPPVDRSLGVNPIHAARCRPDWKWPGSISVTKVSAVIGPTPGISANATLTGLALCAFMRPASISLSRASRRPISLTKHRQHVTRDRRNAAIRDDRLQQGADLGKPLPGDHPELCRMTPERVDQLRALTNQQLARAQNHQLGLLLRRFHRHKAHARARRRFTDGFGIIAIILAALDEGLDVLRRDQPHPMALTAQNPRPVMRPAAGLQNNIHRTLLGKKSREPRALQIAPKHRTPLAINPMQRENRLGRVNRDALKLGHVDGPFVWSSTTTQTFGTRCRRAVHTNNDEHLNRARLRQCHRFRSADRHFH